MEWALCVDATEVKFDVGVKRPSGRIITGISAPRLVSPMPRRTTRPHPVFYVVPPDSEGEELMTIIPVRGDIFIIRPMQSSHAAEIHNVLEIFAYSTVLVNANIEGIVHLSYPWSD